MNTRTRTRIRPTEKVKPKAPKQTEIIGKKARGIKPKSNAGQKDMRYDEDRIARLIEYLIAGNTYKNACLLTSIGESTFWRWMQEGEKAEDGTKAKEFWERIKSASATAEHRNIMVIQKAAGGDKSNGVGPVWQAAAWFLERRNPDQWGRKDRIALGGDPDGSPIVTGQVSEKMLTDKEAMATLQAVMKRAVK